MAGQGHVDPIQSDKVLDVVHLYSSSKFDINTSRKRIHNSDNTLKQSIMGLYL
jgi:hypothetical protein